MVQIARFGHHGIFGCGDKVIHIIVTFYLALLHYEVIVVTYSSSFSDGSLVITYRRSFLLGLASLVSFDLLFDYWFPYSEKLDKLLV